MQATLRAYFSISINLSAQPEQCDSTVEVHRGSTAPWSGPGQLDVLLGAAAESRIARCTHLDKRAFSRRGNLSNVTYPRDGLQGLIRKTPSAGAARLGL